MNIEEALQDHIVSQAFAESKILKIVLIGKTGEGKSSTGNSLLKEKRFLQKFGLKPGTRETSWETTTLTVDGTEYQLLVIDTPGLFDASRSEEEIQSQVRRCITIDSNHSNTLTGSIHAFFLVMKTETRFTPEMQNTLNIVATTFGGLHMNPYLFVVFTGADGMAANGITKEEFMRECVDDKVREKIKDTGNDPIFVNNQLMANLGSNSDHIDNWRQNVIRQILGNLENRLHYIPYSYINFATDRIQSEASQLIDKYAELIVEKCGLFENFENLEVEYKDLGKTSAANGVAGSAFSLGVGIPLIIAGIVMSVPSLGASVILSGTGAAFCAAGGIVAGGGAVYGHLQRTELNQQVKGKVKSFFDKAIKLLTELNRVKRELLEAKIRLWPALLAMKLSKEKDLSALNLSDGGIASVSAYTLLTSGGQSTLMAALISSDTILKLAGFTVVSMVPILGAAVGAVTDVINLVFSANRLVKSAEDAKKIFDELRNKVDKLSAELKTELETLLVELEEFRSKPEESCTCIICLELWDTPVVCAATQMHVSGCQKCVAEWHQREESPSCPICRLPWPDISTTPDNNGENENEP